MRCSENESDVIVLSRFRLRLKDDLRRELIVRDVSTLEQAIQIVQDLDQSQISSFTRRAGYRDNANKTIAVKFQPNSSQSRPPLQGMKTTARESQVSHLDPFSRLDVSSANGLVTSQHGVRVRQGC